MKKTMERLEGLLELGGTKKNIVLLAISGIALLFSLSGLPLPFDAAWIAILLCGIPIVLEAVIGLVTAFDIKADVLVSLALIASVCIGEDFAAGEIAFIMQLGGLLEELTVSRARAGIEKLVHLTPQTARVVRSNSEKIIPAEQVQVGDILRVQSGETVPVDGVILSGQTSINQAVMTGESLPVDKTVGDEVKSGTVNQYGAFEMEAVKVGGDSSIQRMIRLVQSADAGKAKIVGLGVRAKCGGQVVIAGNEKLLSANNIQLSTDSRKSADGFITKGCTVVYVGIDGAFAGFLALSDTLRTEAKETIQAIKDTGIRPLLLTGDHENAAYTIAGQLGIDDCHAGCLPEDKLSWIDTYQNRNEPVCMIGDGINDAPALKKAMVGIAMGGVGSDIAVDAADIALVDDEVKELPHLLRLSKRMMRTIRHNLTFSMTLNFVAIILAITGILNPVVGALVHNAGSVFVIINSALLLKWRSK